jgi:hypothetical protein
MASAPGSVRAPLVRFVPRVARTFAGRVRAVPTPLALLLVVSAILGIAWATVLPPFQGPDETDHFAYVQHLAQTGTAPSSSTYGGAGSYSTEEQNALDMLGLRPLIASPEARPLWDGADVARWAHFDARLPPDGRSNGDGLDPLGKNPPLYYAYESLWYWASPSHALFDRLLLMRLASVLLLLGTVALTWVAVSELTQLVWARVLATGAVALEPQLSFMGGIVNADVLLVTIWTAFVALTVRTLKRGPTGRRVIGLCALAAASALTHGRGIAIVPSLAVVLGLAWWRYRPARRDVARWGAAGTLVLVGGLGAFSLFTAGSGGSSLYGGQTNYIHQGGANLRQFLSFVWQFYFPRLSTMTPRIGPSFGFHQMFVETFYGAFGWLDVRYSQRVYTLLQLASVGGLVALYTAIVARRRHLRRQWPVFVALLVIGVSLVGMLHLVSYLSVLGSGDPLIVGRYLLPIVTLFGLAIAFVATSLPRRLGPLFAAVVLGGGVVLQLAGLGLTVARFYG